MSISYDNSVFFFRMYRVIVVLTIVLGISNNAKYLLVKIPDEVKPLNEAKIGSGPMIQTQRSAGR